MIAYEKYLEKCYHTSSIYIQHLLRYQTQTYDDPDLSPQTQGKMKQLLLKLLERIEEFLSVVRAEKEVAKAQSEPLHKELIAEEFAQLNTYIEKFFATTISLQQAKDLSLIHICRCRRYAVCRSRWSPYH
eukprot:TRINITY_DN15562_c0_g1_i1.p1 TRINITY_DN15562_c0_g1~~TRINITY_DN15562_c0_g1_i1.p1  ORF type:complete len:130 (-),score=25.93 TRINITY_DN15562_c0_g1_i1:16-405(-)